MDARYEAAKKLLGEVCVLTDSRTRGIIPAMQPPVSSPACVTPRAPGPLFT